MGIIFGALAGAGDYIARSEQDNQRRMDTMEIENHRSDLEMRKAKLVESLREQSAINTEKRAEEPLKRFGAALEANQQSEVPVTAAPVTSLAGKQGQTKTGDALVTGFTGDMAKIKADIMALPEGADKAQALQQLQSQFAAETEVAQKGIIGQTRKMTTDEALSKTLTDTMASDPVALTAYEKNLGRPARDERRIDVTEKLADNRAIAAAKDSERKAQADAQKYEISLKQLNLSQATSQGTLEASNRKIDAWIENEAAKRDNDATKAENGGKGQNPDKLGAVVNAMNATVLNLTNNGKGSTPESKAAWQKAYDNAVSVRDRATFLLNESLTDRGAPSLPPKTGQAAPAPVTPSKADTYAAPAAAPGMPAGAKQIGTSGGKPVYETPDGKRFIQK